MWKSKIINCLACIQWTIVFCFLLSPSSFATAQKTFDKKKQNSFSSPFKLCRVLEPNNSQLKLIASDNISQNIAILKDNSLIVSYDLKTGTENWRTMINGRPSKVFSSSEKFLYYASVSTNKQGQDTHLINAISLNTGIQNWQREVKSSASIYNLKNKEILLNLDEQNVVTALNTQEGRFLWENSFGRKIFLISQNAKETLNILSDEASFLVSIENGKILERNEFPSTRYKSINSLSSDANSVIIGNSNGDIYRKSLSGSISDWNFKTGGRIFFLERVGNEILAVSFDNFVYFIEAKTGKLKWKKRISDRIDLRPIIIENQTFISSTSGRNITVIDLNNGKVINQIFLNVETLITDEFHLVSNYLVIPTSDGVYIYSPGSCN